MNELVNITNGIIRRAMNEVLTFQSDMNKHKMQQDEDVLVSRKKINKWGKKLVNQVESQNDIPRAISKVVLFGLVFSSFMLGFDFGVLFVAFFMFFPICVRTCCLACGLCIVALT